MSAALCMSALDDPEDDLPHQRSLYLMSQDDQDDSSRNSETIAPDAVRDTDLDTLPPDADQEAKADEAMRTILPAPKPPSNIEQLAERELVRLYRTAIGMHESLLGASGLLEQSRRNTVEDLARVVDAGFDRVWQRIGPRLTEHERRLTALETTIAELQGKLDQQQRDLNDTNIVIKQVQEEIARAAGPAPTPSPELA